MGNFQKNIRFTSYTALLALVFGTLPTSVDAQIYNYTNDGTGMYSTKDANVAATGLSRVNGATLGAACSNGFDSQDFSTSVDFVTPLPAIQFTVTPNSGYQLSVTSISVEARPDLSPAGPTLGRLAYSTNGGTSWIDAGSNTTLTRANTCATATTVSWPVVFQTSNAVLVRLYAFGAGNANGDMSVTNFVLNGTVICSPTTAFNVTGGGNFCAGSSGAAVGLDGSTTVDSYQLVRDGNTNVGAPVNGTGNAINFGNQTAGTYTVVATRIGQPSCTATMTGSVVVTSSSALTLTAASTTTTAQCGDLLDVTVRISNSPCELANLQYSVNWDPGRFQYDTIVFANIDDQPPIVGLVDTATGKIRYTWNDGINPCNTVLSDGTLLLTLTLKALGCNATNAGVTITSNPLALEASDCSFNDITINPVSTVAVAIVDATAPTFACPANLTLECVSATNYVAAIQAWIAASPTTATDACNGTVPVLNNYNNTDVPAVCDSITVVFTATDSCTNAKTCTQKVYLRDTQMPTITTCAVTRDVEGCTTAAITGPAFSTTTAVSSEAEFENGTNQGNISD
ncbi:MAG: hypothetical protein ABMA02_15615, partial [Saprospiraceae bacterium]